MSAEDFEYLLEELEENNVYEVDYKLKVYTVCSESREISSENKVWYFT